MTKTEQELEATISAYLRGETLREIAEREGVHESTVWRRLRAAGVEKAPLSERRGGGMERVVIFLPAPLAEQVRREARKSGETVSSLLRRVVTEQYPGR